MTWYSNEMQIIAIVLWFVAIIIIIAKILIETNTIIETIIALSLILVVTLGLFKYITTADAKIYEEMSSKYKYKIEIFKGKSCDTYYTNEFKIKNGIVYFNNRCADNFSIETLK
jgi:hypothetical protein